MLYSVSKKTNIFSHLTSPNSFLKKAQEKIPTITKFLEFVDYRWPISVISNSVSCIPQPYTLGSVRAGTIFIGITTVSSAAIKVPET